MDREKAIKILNPQFDPESIHVCMKLSGEAAQFSEKEKFDSIVRFLSAKWAAHCSSFEFWFLSRQHMRMDECAVDTKDQGAKQLKVRFSSKLFYVGSSLTSQLKRNITLTFADMACKPRQWCWGWMEKLVHSWGRPLFQQHKNPI